MPSPACNAAEDEPGPLVWRCNLRPGHEPPHAYVQFNDTYHEWTDRP
jgi:hypothetical protein